MHYSRAAGRRERAAVDKVRVAEVGVPVKIVVDGVVDAALVFAAETDIERSHTIVLKKRGVVRARAERGNAQISAFANFFALLRYFGVGDFVELLALPYTELCFRIGYLAGDIISEFFERVRPFHFEVTAAIAVRIDVRDGVHAQFVIVLLCPFGRAEESRLFAVPRA